MDKGFNLIRTNFLSVLIAELPRALLVQVPDSDENVSVLHEGAHVHHTRQGLLVLRRESGVREIRVNHCDHLVHVTKGEGLDGLGTYKNDWGTGDSLQALRHKAFIVILTLTLT